MRSILRISVVVILLSSVCQAQRGRRAPGPGVINLPHTVSDNAGGNWVIYQQGWLQYQGNMPLYAQGAMLNINGNDLNVNTNQASLDDKTGEIVIEGNVGEGMTVQRRILIKPQDGYVRYIDIIRNPSPQPMNANIQINSSFNFQIQSVNPVSDPRDKSHALAVAALLQQGRMIIEMYGMKGVKTLPRIEAQPNNNLVRATMQFTIPTGKQMAFFHLHGTCASPDAATQLVTSASASKMLADVPNELRRAIVNAASAQAIGDREVTRGELYDLVELRSGDVLNGTIAEKSFKLQTFYGTVELPAERVAALFNVGQVRPRQLVVTVDGEVFGGTLAKDSLALQLASGQTTQVPLTQISRAGYRRRSGEPEEWNFDQPMISLRSGERMLVTMPTTPFDVMTRYGLLKLKPEMISSIAFQSEDHRVHAINLADGSKFAGLASADHFDLQLTGTAAKQVVTFPASMVEKIQISKAPDDDDSAPTLEVSSHDVFVGKLTGQLKLETNFDTITLNATELRSLSHSPDGGLDVQAVLWDQSTLSGQLRETQVNCELQSGLTVSVPVAMLERYTNPKPKPSELMVQRIKQIVAELGADDFHRRESAEAQLVAMGSGVAEVLKELSGTQSMEAQQRIESVLRQVLKKPAASPGVAGPAE